MSHIPWIGLAALIAMFVLPHVPNWLFEGPRTVKHRPRRHICADCRAPWTDGHACTPPRRDPATAARRAAPTGRVGDLVEAGKQEGGDP